MNGNYTLGIIVAVVVFFYFLPEIIEFTHWLYRVLFTGWEIPKADERSSHVRHEQTEKLENEIKQTRFLNQQKKNHEPNL